MALKKIDVSELREGMFLVEFEGSWLASPFWKKRFLLERPADVQLARASALRVCWIDTAKGLDTLEDAKRPHPEQARRSNHTVLYTRQAPAEQRGPSLEAELHRARALCSGARASIVAMFSTAHTVEQAPHWISRAGARRLMSAAMDKSCSRTCQPPSAKTG